MIEEADLDALLAADQLPIPSSWGPTITGRPLPNVVAIIRSQRSNG